MLDFVKIKTKMKNEKLYFYPDFAVIESTDLMIKSKDFYAVWDEEKGLWSKSEYDVRRLIDNEIRDAVSKHPVPDSCVGLYLSNFSTNLWTEWKKYCHSMPDRFEPLDTSVTFANSTFTKEDHVSKTLPYNLSKGDFSAYEKLIGTLYEPDERQKIEWAIGAIISGDSKKIQKFIVLYGDAGSGKSTILNIIQMIFKGYYSVFEAKNLASSNDQFALEAFKDNPLVAIQHDGDLSRIEDNTKLNSIISHEKMMVNEKFKAKYPQKFHSFLFMGTNSPVKITDAKSGMTRRLIDVRPSGDKVCYDEYVQLMEQIKFELGAIAYHCLEVYNSLGESFYDNYIPLEMISATNDFYDFVEYKFDEYMKTNSTTLSEAWEDYKQYCEFAKVGFVMNYRRFKEELKNYFNEYSDRITINGEQIRKRYSGFKAEKFGVALAKNTQEDKFETWLDFNTRKSVFDLIFADLPAQEANKDGIPTRRWDNVTSKLSDLDTSKLHYVAFPEAYKNLVVIDFDLKNEKGEKDYILNLKAASKWPKTYAELSKSGVGIHLHYFYNGDLDLVSSVFDENIEIKVFKGNASLRRQLTRCNDIQIATISSGLPVKEVKTKMYSDEGFKDSKALRNFIFRALRKEHHGHTRPEINFIHDKLEECYNNGMSYDIRDLRGAIGDFAANSHNQATKCLEIVGSMKFCSRDYENDEVNDILWQEEDDGVYTFFDLEVFPNLFIVGYAIGDEAPVMLVNPTPEEIKPLLDLKLIGFNNLNYDNPILYARSLGVPNAGLYKLSKAIINDKQKPYPESRNISFTDIYDFSSKKQSLKKWEIEMDGVAHLELGIPWDEPVPEEMWPKVVEYCANDVKATRALFYHPKIQADFAARKIQCEIVKRLHGISATTNETTNQLSAKIIFGSDKTPQTQFNYRDLSKPVPYTEYENYKVKFGSDYIFRVFDAHGLPQYQNYNPGEILPDGWSILPFFPGYTFECKQLKDGDSKFKYVSTYMGDEIGEGGRVYADFGMYFDVWDADVTSQHPHSIIFEVLFGPKYTKIFSDIVAARVAVKSHDFETASKLLNGALEPFLNEDQAEGLAQALKIVINSIYGLTIASFMNKFRDTRNKDNIVAKRGALFMTLLKSEVEKLGYKVAHIKTDSIKIPKADDKIKEFVIKFGKEFGYSFTTEAEFDRFCLVNNAVYIARHKDHSLKHEGWTATGTQFQVPYVFKTLFSHEEIEFKDLCETKSVTSSMYLDMNENLNEGEHDYRFVGRVGQFCPIIPGMGGGVLLRKAGDKFNSVTGAKDYRWLESETVLKNHWEDRIDMAYYEKQVDEAVASIREYGYFDGFVSDKLEDMMMYIDNDPFETEELPF